MSTATAASTFEEALAFFESAFPPIALEALSLVGQGISIITPDYRIVWASPALESWAGPLDKIRGRPCYEVYQRREEVCPGCPSAKAFATGERASCLQPGFAADGTLLQFELTCDAVKDAAGTPRLVMEIAADITQTLAGQARERLLTSLLDCSPNMVAFVDVEGRITDANPAAAARVGCERADLIGRPFTALLGYALPDAEAGRMLEASLTNGWRGEVPLVSRRGKTTWIDLSTSPVKDRDGRTVGVVSIANDITQRRRAEDALRSSEQRYRQLFERLNDAVFIADPLTGRLLDVNAAAQRLTGYSRDELVGMPQNRLDPTDQAESLRERFGRHIAQGTAGDFDGEIVRKDGAVVPVRISASVTEICGVSVIQGICRAVSDRGQAPVGDPSDR